MIHCQKQAFPGTGDTLIFFATEDGIKKNNNFHKLDKALQGKLSLFASKHKFTGKRNDHFSMEGNTLYSHILVYGLGSEKDFSPSIFRDIVAGATRVALSLKPVSVCLYYPHELLKAPFEGGKEMALGVILAQYHFDKYKGKEDQKKKHVIKDVFVFTEQEDVKAIKEGIKSGEKIASAIMLARNLVNEPASHVHPETMVREAKRIQQQLPGRISMQVLERKECEALGMGAFLGVAAGSEREPKFIVLTYRPVEKTERSRQKTICLIGKSITFDSGGLSLKPSKAMEDMKIDMAGGALVLGVFQALATGIEVEHEVVGILPACENMPSGKAMRPGDIVTAMNGKTIEVLNTDAEGRLALADAASYAVEVIKPDLIIDAATLTGACMVALGDEIAGVFGNDRAETKKFLNSTKEEGEEAWELPLYTGYLDAMKSDIAQIKNVSGKGLAGAITAALFISEFVGKTKWIHVDIAGPAYNSGKPRGITGRGGTGWGVLSIINLLRAT